MLDVADSTKPAECLLSPTGPELGAVDTKSPESTTCGLLGLLQTLQQATAKQ